MKLNYASLTFEDIDTYAYHYFICDGDSKKIIVVEKEKEA